MSTAITTQAAPPANPFAQRRDASLAAGTVEIESNRAVAEVQAKLIIAKRFPRDPAHAYEQIMQTCKRHAFAEASSYSFPRGGETVSGPSIRLAEELARAWGNVDFGVRELSQKDGVSEMQAFAWDLETNVISTQNFTVKHERHTRQGVTRLTDPRDIYELTANLAGRRLRARILAIIPPDLVQAAEEECARTLAGGNGVPISDRVKKMVAAFAKFDIQVSHLEKHLGHPLGECTGEELANLTKIHNALRDGMTKPSDVFDLPKPAAPAAAAVNVAVGKVKGKQAEKPAEPAPSAAQAPAPDKGNGDDFV
jgi:hypothetical protein